MTTFRYKSITEYNKAGVAAIEAGDIELAAELAQELEKFLEETILIPAIKAAAEAAKKGK